MKRLDRNDVIKGKKRRFRDCWNEKRKKGLKMNKTSRLIKSWRRTTSVASNQSR